MVGNLAPVGMNQEDLHQVTKPDHQNKHHDPDLERAEAAQFKSQDGKDADSRDDGRDKHDRGASQPQVKEVAAEKQVEAQRGAKKFGQVGSQRRQLRGHPQENCRTAGKMLAAVLRQGGSGSNAQLGGEVLDEDGHQVRPQQHPQQLVAEPGPGNQIRAEISRVDIGDAGHKRGPEPGQKLAWFQIGKQLSRPGR